MMKEKVEALKAEISKYIATKNNELEEFRLKFISRKSVISDLFTDMKNVAPEDRKEMGQLLNELKNSAQNKFKKLIASLKESTDEKTEAPLDLTLPPIPETLGSLHPLTITKKRILEIFERIGFNVSYGPEIEDDWHNFSALNFPENHPAREMQDTFFIEKDPDIALRTHTSSVQVRVMEKQKPPIRTLSPGRVFRNEAISVRAHCIFHQVEGLYVDKNVSFADLKQTMLYFSKEFFGKNTKIRLRPSFFPFTEPSAELDISCFICDQKGCKICKHTGWVEIGGCGMVDPNVLKNCNIDPEEYTGFAFGMGIER
ncbi:MAG: phenylalanine--tRNA ligase subunit alpha, partial [Cyclobacteriaceae bacterium]|nr:phenylalanine--tRNA ligase subunit alpha [Cyclobacteriaceae bacterium]